MIAHNTSVIFDVLFKNKLFISRFQDLRTQNLNLSMRKLNVVILHTLLKSLNTL